MNIYSYEVYLKHRDEPHKKEIKKKMVRHITEKQKKETPFQKLFLKNDHDKTVEATKVNEIDIKDLKSHLEKGEFVCISRKRGQKLNVNFIADESVKEPWYLLRT